MTKQNSLNIDVTKPNQELIVMRGIPGGGKSTEAAKRVGNGIIHSTDTLIEKAMNYRDFFADMAATGDYKPLNRMHSLNLTNSINSMKAGVTPIIIDNTNIKHADAKSYVVAALTMGYADENIHFVDVGSAGLTAEELAERNTHGVPLDKIKQMMASHKGQGEITLYKVLNAKDMYKASNILYSAVVLDKQSHDTVVNTNYPCDIPDGWILIAHHMTIAFGKGVDNKDDLGKEVTLTVKKVGISDMAMAVQVEGYPSNNAIPHVTIAINPDGGKAVMSNDITRWYDVKPFVITGVVTNIAKKDGNNSK